MKLLQLLKRFTLRPLRKALRSLREKRRKTEVRSPERAPRDEQYSQEEILTIMNNCRSEREVYDVVARFRWLMLYRKQRHFYLVHQLSHTRLQEIYKNEK